jgi:hypothetical protein
VLESFSSHLFVRQVNMFILNLCLTFHSFIHYLCYSYALLIRVFYANLFCIYIFLKKIQHIQSQYGSHIVPQWWLDELLFAVRTQVPRVTISGLSWACLGRWYGVFELCFNVLLSRYHKFGRSFILIYLVPLLKVLKLNTPKNNDH